MVLASTADTTFIDELANIADKIMEVATPSISAVSQSQLFSDMKQLYSQISDFPHLNDEILSYSFNHPSPTIISVSPLLVHQKFGNLAKKCREPCSKLGNASASSH